MRVQTEEWRRFIPGVRMYRGKKTFFYNGEILYERGDGRRRYLIHDEEERKSWEVIIILPGVQVIPEHTFTCCVNVETVIMADTVTKIKEYAFSGCLRLTFIKLSENLKYIQDWAFADCTSLTSIFIPPSCRWICNYIFENCEKLIILQVPRRTLIQTRVIRSTALSKTSLFQNRGNHTNENDCIRNINRDEEYELHRACASFHPLENILLGILKRRGLVAFRTPNAIGITPMQYLAANPYAHVDQHKLIKRYIAEMVGEHDL